MARVRRTQYYEDAILPVRTINGVWWMGRGTIRILKVGRCIVGSVGPRSHRPVLLDEKRISFTRWAVTFKLRDHKS